MSRLGLERAGLKPGHGLLGGRRRTKAGGGDRPAATEEGGSAGGGGLRREDPDYGEDSAVAAAMLAATLEQNAHADTAGLRRLVRATAGPKLNTV